MDKQVASRHGVDYDAIERSVRELLATDNRVTEVFINQESHTAGIEISVHSRVVGPMQTFSLTAKEMSGEFVGTTTRFTAQVYGLPILALSVINMVWDMTTPAFKAAANKEGDNE